MDREAFQRFQSTDQLELPLRVPGRAQRRPVAGPPRPGPSSAAPGLDAALAATLGEPVELEVHDNRSIMVSWKRLATGRGVRLRLHRMFAQLAGDSPTDLAATLADFIRGRGVRRQTAARWIDRYIREHQQEIRPGAAPDVGPARGRFHDLQAIFDQLNAAFFDRAIRARIGWGRAPSRGRRRSIKMGAYLHDHALIRIHPALDREDVPDYMVEFVVYHEMCHQACPPEATHAGRQRIHTSAFRRREAEHPDRVRALAWEKRNLKHLLRS